MRYINSKYEIFTEFLYENNKILFTEQKNKYPKIGVEFRGLIYPLPKTTEKWQDYMIHKTEDPNKLFYRRGAPTNYVRIYGNPHITVKKLRQALYYKLKIKEQILESFPHWNFESDSFEWYKEISKADNQYEEMLFKPYEAVDYFLKDLMIKPVNFYISHNDWENHVSNISTVVYELCSVAMSKTLISIIRESPYLKKNL